MDGIYEELKRKSEYAIKSVSINLMYQTYGEVCMARQLGAISREQYFKLNEMLIVDGINNPRAFAEGVS